MLGHRRYAFAALMSASDGFHSQGLWHLIGCLGPAGKVFNACGSLLQDHSAAAVRNIPKNVPRTQKQIRCFSKIG